MVRDSRHLAARGAYRIWQFWQVLWAGPLSAQARQEVEETLTDEQLALFLTQTEAGQQHGYRVMRLLADAGHDQPDLLAAALLHDVGKYRFRYTWIDRAKVVLTHRIRPGLSRQWSQGPPNSWNRAYVVKETHPEWGADALAEAGGTTLSVALVRRHQEKLLASSKNCEENRLLTLLQWADDQS